MHGVVLCLGNLRRGKEMLENINLMYAILIVGLAVFLMYTNVQSMLKAKKVYKEHDMKSFQVLDISKKWMLFYTVMLVMVVIMLVLGKSDMEMTVVAMGLIVIIIAELAGSTQRFRLFYNDKLFIYMGDVIRIKGVRGINQTKGWFAKSEVVLFDGRKVIVPKPFGLKLTELTKTKKK